MESSVATLVQYPSPKEFKGENGGVIFDKTLFQKLAHIPQEFHWPAGDLVGTSQEELNEPLIDLGAMRTGDEAAIANAAELVRKACMEHGFFQVTNHGVDPDLINAAYQGIDAIFNLPLSKKLSIRKKPGSLQGYSGAHADRFSSMLPWKEILTFKYSHNNEYKSQVVDYFKSALGEDFEHTGVVFQKYCKAMEDLSVAIEELLAISLGVDRLHYRKFFEDAESTLRLNSYPVCKDSNLTLGTGPHSDPTSLTLLHQDQVGGLEVLVDNKWLAVHPRPDAFVINIGDTFMALTNGIYKSCLHRVLVNKETERKSLSYFVNPKGDKTVRPPENLFSNEEPRNYPDFTWSEFLEFTQKHYRSDIATLQGFIQFLRTSKPSN